MFFITRVIIGTIIAAVIVAGIIAMVNQMGSRGNGAGNIVEEKIDANLTNKDLSKKTSSGNQNVIVDPSCHLFESPVKDFSICLPKDWIIPSDRSEYDNSYFYSFQTAYGPIHEQLSNSQAVFIQILRYSKNRDDSTLDTNPVGLDFDQFKKDYINYLKSHLSLNVVDENHIIKYDTEINGHEAVVVKYTYQCYVNPLIECKEWKIFVRGNDDSLYYVLSANTLGLFNRYQNAIEASFKTFIVH